MKLASPVTITLPPIKRPDGEVRTLPPLTLTELDITIVDNAKHKHAMVQIGPCPRSLVLWRGDAYDAAGDYTQAEVEARVLELLGSDPAKTLTDLFSPVPMQR